VLEHRELTAVRVDQGREVLTVGLKRQRREWPPERDDIGKRVGVLVDRGGSSYPVIATTLWCGSRKTGFLLRK
jgi:hypothetical protein